MVESVLVLARAAAQDVVAVEPSHKGHGHLTRYPCRVDGSLYLEIVCPAWHPEAENLVDAVQLLSDEGVTAVEMGLSIHPGYFNPRDGFELQTLLAELSTYGVRINSIHAPFGPSYDISSPQDSIHERGVEAIIDSIELASLLDSKFVIVHASDYLDGGNGRRMERARGVLREMSIVARESGLILALENLPPGFLGQSPEEIFTLLDGTDREAIAVCFDSGHANLSGHFIEYAEALLPHAVTTHLHDNDGLTDQHLFPGGGSIDWTSFGSVYKRVGCRASMMLECKLPDSMIWSEAFQRLRVAMGD